MARRPRRSSSATSARALCAAAVLAAGCNRTGAPAAQARADAAVAAQARDGGGGDPCDALTPEQRGMLVARVGESRLTLCDFARRVGSQNQYLRARLNSPEQRRALLRSWVDSELLAAEARARGLDQDPAVRHAVTSQLARQLEGQLRASVPPPIVTDAEVEAYYNEHRAEYDTPEQVRASHIVVGSREAAERVLAEAQAAAGDDARWRELVRRHSADAATRDIGGDLGFFAAEGGTTVPREVAQAAFVLRQPGNVAPQVVATARGGPGGGPGFHVVRLTARREALHRTLDEVRRPIRNRLWRERFDEAQERAVREVLEQLRRGAAVTVDEAALAQVRLDLPPPGTPEALRGVGPGGAPVPRLRGAPAAGAPGPR